MAVYDYGLQGHGGSARGSYLTEQTRQSEQIDSLSKSAENVERAKMLLRSNSEMLRPDVPVPSELLTNLDPEIRITALQWSVGRGEAFTDALTQALMDEDSRVQSAARELLLQHGIDDQGVAGITAEAEFDDAIRVRSLVAALLGQAPSPAR